MAFFDKEKIVNLKLSEVALETATDLVEFACLVSADGNFYLGEVMDIIADNEALFNEKETHWQAIQNGLADSLEISETRVQEIRELIMARKQRFQLSYPFSLGGHANRTVILESEMNPIMKLYVVLLASSVFKVASNAAAINKLGHLFEQISGLAFRKLVPDTFNTELFGSGGKSNNAFAGSLLNKVEELSQLLHIPLSHRAYEVFGERNYGDGGLDWLAWYSFDEMDKESHLLFYFAQCACGENWIDKQNDCTEIWEKILQFDTRPVSVFITPKCTRNPDWRFSNFKHIAYRNIFIDRSRFIELAQLNGIALIDQEVNTIYYQLFENIENLRLEAGW